MSLKQSLTRTVGRKVLVAKKNSPHIFFAAGVVGVVGATVLACKATLKLEETLEEVYKSVDQAKDAADMAGITEQELSRVLLVKYTRGGVQVAKLYAPAVILGGASIGLLAGSHIQLTRRNSALSAALAVMSKAFDDYRIRVRSEVGDVREDELYRSIEELEYDVDGKKGKIKAVCPGLGLSPYARRFCRDTTAEWQPNSELNRNFILCQQNYANHKLHARGHVLLNDVYDALGMERSSAGAVVGWVLNGKGDGYIDFGMYQRPDTIQFTIGDEYDVWLDFNVDGEVFRLIDEVVGG